MRKKHFDYNKHNETGARIQEIYNYLFRLSSEIKIAYPVKSKVVNLSKELEDKMLELRIALENCAAVENPSRPNHEITCLYFRNGTKEFQHLEEKIDAERSKILKEQHKEDA